MKSRFVVNVTHPDLLLSMSEIHRAVLAKLIELLAEDHSAALPQCEADLNQAGFYVDVEQVDLDELCVCEACGHVQAEPNWCHKCNRRVRLPDWAKGLLGELERARSALEDVWGEVQREETPDYRFLEKRFFEGMDPASPVSAQGGTDK